MSSSSTPSDSAPLDSTPSVDLGPPTTTAVHLTQSEVFRAFRQQISTKAYRDANPIDLSFAAMGVDTNRMVQSAPCPKIVHTTGGAQNSDKLLSEHTTS